MSTAEEVSEEQQDAQPAKMAPSDESETPGAALNRAVRANEYLSVRHALPKTNISNVILYENTSQERHLVRQLSSLTLRRERQKNVLDLQRRAFVQKQTRKQKKWKREDEFSLNNMNLPSLDKKAEKRPTSMHIMYRNPDYELKSKSKDRTNGKLPPLMEVKREKTEIIFHKDKTFITRVPMSFALNKETFKHHVKYCGQKYLTKGKAAQDDRFQKLNSSLNPTFGDQSIPKDMRRRGSASSTVSSRVSSRAKKRKQSTKIVIPFKQMSATSGRGSERSIHCKSVTKVERSKSDLAQTRETSAINRKDIISEFKSGDIRSLSKKLSAVE